MHCRAPGYLHLPQGARRQQRQDADDICPRNILLCPCREWATNCGSKQNDKRRPLHSITSSARASSAGGMVRPSVLAVFRLITNSNLKGRSIGISPTLSPPRILSAISTARG